MKCKLILVLLITYLSSIQTFASECSEPFKNSDSFSFKQSCDSEGNIVLLEKYLKKSGNKVVEKHFKNGFLKVLISFRDNIPFTKSTYKYPTDDKSFFIQSNYIFPGNLLEGRYHIQLVSGLRTIVREIFTDDNVITHEHFYNAEGQVVKRHVLTSKEEIQKIVNFFYHTKEDEKPYAFKTYDAKGELIGDYSMDRPFSFDQVYKKYEHEFYHQKLRHFKNVNRIKVAIIDSGIDFMHPDLAYKMFNNPFELLNGVDDDDNGLVDDLMGWSLPQKIGFPYETIGVQEKGVPNSHGTHVASIFTRDLEGVAIVPFVGDYGEANFLKKMTTEFRNKDIQFANMSFTFPHYRTQQIEKSTHMALNNLISRNPETLFFVASGNDSELIASSVFKAKFPAAFLHDQVFTIGALDTDFLHENMMHTYVMADYSNYSSWYVDILAPGTKVNGASLGGGYIRHTGTSMATPYALREGLNLKLHFPELNGNEIKKIMMHSAYIPDIDSPFPVRSGGMIFPRRSIETARVYLRDGGSIKDAALTVRRDDKFILKNEDVGNDYIEKIKLLWEERSL